MSNEMQKSETLKGLADEANEAHRECQASVRTTLEQAQQCGEILSRAKRLIDHGQWETWLEANFEGSVRTAQTYMRVAANPQEFAPKAQNSALLSIDAAVKLLATPKPEPVKPKRAMTPELLFADNTVIASQAHVEWVKSQMAPWTEQGYLPLIDFHQRDGCHVWHSMHTPSGLVSKDIALLFVARECGLPYDELSELAVALDDLRTRMGEDWEAHCIERFGDPVWVNGVIDRWRDTSWAQPEAPLALAA